MKHYKRQILVMAVGLTGMAAIVCFVAIPITDRIESINMRVFAYYCSAFVCSGLFCLALAWAISRDVNDEMNDR